MLNIKALLSQLLEVAPDRNLPPTQARDLRTLNLCTCLVVIVAIPFVFKYYAMDLLLMSFAVSLAVVAGVLNLILLRKTLNLVLCGHIAIGIIYFLLIFSNSISGGFYDPNFSLLYTIPLISGFILGFRALIGYTILTIFTVSIFYVLPSIGIAVPDLIPSDQHGLQSLANRFSAIGVIVALAAGFIYERDATHSNLEKEKVKAVQSSKAKSRFLSTMSHEIRTPMNAIIGYSQLMQNDPRLHPDLRTNMETINRSGEHLLALIDDVLEMSKIEAGGITINSEHFDSYELLKDIEMMFSKKCDGKHLQLLVDQSEELPQFLFADRAKISQILINLIGNSLKFTHKGGISIRAKASDLDGGKKVRLIIEVEDSGNGISPEDHDKVFGKFEQTQSGLLSGQGTGLGLSISRKYARLMAGDLTFRSEQGKGSVFRLEITCESGDVSEMINQTKQDRVIGLVGDRPSFRLLIVDDNAINRDLLIQLLAPVGFQLEEAVDGKEALLKFEMWKPDLILMDNRMPVMSGIEVITKIRSMPQGATIPIVVISASAFKEDKAKILTVGANAFIRKPFRQQEVLDKIAELLNLEYLYDQDLSATEIETSGNRHSVESSPATLTENNSAILIVEDNTVNQILCRKQLSSLGISSDIAENGEEAVKMFKLHSYQLILMDCEMPKMDGYQASKAIRDWELAQGAKNRVPILALSAHLASEENERAEKAGMNAFLSKPIKLEHLKTLLEEYQIRSVIDRD